MPRAGLPPVSHPGWRLRTQRGNPEGHVLYLCCRPKAEWGSGPRPIKSKVQTHGEGVRSGLSGAPATAASHRQQAARVPSPAGRAPAGVSQLELWR